MYNSGLREFMKLVVALCSRTFSGRRTSYHDTSNPPHIQTGTSRHCSCMNDPVKAFAQLHLTKQMTTAKKIRTLEFDG